MSVASRGHPPWGVPLLTLLQLQVITATIQVVVTPDFCLVSSSLSLAPLQQGLARAQAGLHNLQTSYLGGSYNLSHEATRLLESVARAGEWRMARIKDISSRLEEGLGGYKEDDNLRERRESNSPLEEGLGGHKEDDNLRVRRDSYSPLYMLGSLADWAIGLTSHQKYSQFQEDTRVSVVSVSLGQEAEHLAMEEAARAVDRTGLALADMQAELETLLLESQDREGQERVVMAVLRLQVSIEAALHGVEVYGLLLEEVLDRLDIGLASRMLYNPEHLATTLLRVNDRHSGLSPLFPSSQLSLYFSLPLTLASLSPSHILSTLRIPLVRDDQRMEVEDTSHHHSLVTLHSSRHRVLLTFPQYRACVHSGRRGDGILCNLRPCMTNLGNKQVTCLTLNSTSFLLTSSANISFTGQCGQGLDEVELTGAGGTYVLHLPEHCRVHSPTIWIESLVSASPPPFSLPSLVPSQTQAGARAGRPSFTYRREGRLGRREGRLGRGEGRLGALHSLLPNPEHHWWLAAGGATSSLLAVFLLATGAACVCWRRREELVAGEEEEEPEKGMKSANGQIYLPAPSDNSSKNKPDLCLPTLPSLPSLPWEPEQEQEEKEFQAVLELLCHSAQRCAGCRQLAMDPTVFSPLMGSIKENTQESLNLPRTSAPNLSLSPSPPPSYTSHSYTPTPYTTSSPYTSSSTPPSPFPPSSPSLLLDFSVLLSPKEEGLMWSCLQRMMKRLTAGEVSQLLLHQPSPIPGHSLALYSTRGEATPT